jgi:hypothetical protein
MFGDGLNEYITATGPGREGLVRVWSNQGVLRASLTPFPGFTGGIYVATGDVDFDESQVPELIVSTAPGTLGQVKVYSFSNGGPQELASFTPFGPTYSDGVQIAVGDVTGDLAGEIIVGRENGSPTVSVFSFDPNVGEAFQIRTFQAYGSNYKGGVTVAAANIDIKVDDPLDNDDYTRYYAEIITGRTSQFPQVKVFDAQLPDVVQRASYMAFDISNPFNRRGINVAAGSTDGLRGAEVYVSLRNSGTIRIFNGWTSGFLGSVRPYPGNFARTVNFFVHTNDRDFLNFHDIGDLITVGGNGRFNQMPLVFFGQFNSPAGLNGSRRAV